MCLESYELDPAKFLSAPRLVWLAASKKTKVKLELLTHIDMLLIVEKEIRGESCHSINRYAKTNYCDKNKEFHIKYWDINSFYGREMSQDLSVNKFNWVEDLSEFNEGIIKSYNEKSNEGYFLEVDVQYHEDLHEPHNYLPFLPEIKNADKIKKILANLYDKKEHAIHIRNLKEALNHGLVWKKFTKSLSLIKKLGIDMNTELRKKVNAYFEKDFLKLVNKSVFSKTMESVRKYCDIKPVATEKKKLFGIQTILSYNKVFLKKSNNSRNEKIYTFMNKPVYLG